MRNLTSVLMILLNISLFGQITDTYYSQQWNLTKINAQGAWNTLGNYGNSDVVIAVLGYGIDLVHENLNDNIWLNPNDSTNYGNGKTDDINGRNFVNNHHLKDLRIRVSSIFYRCLLYLQY